VIDSAEAGPDLLTEDNVCQPVSTCPDSIP
jgi:hypothetical protein